MKTNQHQSRFSGQPKSDSWQSRLVICTATGFGFGFARVMPGTVGALWGIPLAWAILNLPARPLKVAVLATLIAIGIPLCTAASRRLGGKDPGCVVWDEIVTMPLVFLGLSSSQISDLGVLCVGFVLHRVFDITKPPPARQVERLPEGLGIMADDCVAGLYACAALHLILALVG